ncbi:MAG: phosphatase PAP2 family protein [Mycobacteriaceae bacterium]
MGWSDEDRYGKLHVVVAAIIGLVLVGVFIAVASAVHDDPRPFMQDPSLDNLLHHAPGNGFPSDHSCAAGLIAALVVFRHRVYGALLALAAVLVAAARVAAHAHHLQDVVAGLALGVLAAWLGTLLATALISRLALPRRLGLGSEDNSRPRVRGR